MIETTVGESFSINNQQSTISNSPIVSGDALQKAFPKDSQFFADRQSYLAAEYVVLAGGDFFEQLAIDVDQHPQSGLAVFGNIWDELLAGLVELAGAVGFERQQRAEAGCVGRQKAGRRLRDRTLPDLLPANTPGPWRRLLSHRE